MAISVITGQSTGSSGTVLTTGNPQSGGVIQVVNATTGTQVATASTTFIDTTLTATITPKFATSKILVLVSQNGIYTTAVSGGVALMLVRNSTNLIQFTSNDGYITGSTSSAMVTASTCYLDSPATTSAVTYKTQMNNVNAVGSARVQNGTILDTSTITLLEIAA
jgi:hypothetical protein